MSTISGKLPIMKGRATVDEVLVVVETEELEDDDDVDDVEVETLEELGVVLVVS
jgi:hypothetical protein